MTMRAPLTLAEKERIYAEKVRGTSLPAIAALLGCSVMTVRKWWRVARDHGRLALAQPRRSRVPTGVLSRFPPAVTLAALAAKRAHPRWGPDRILVELRRDPALTGLRLPSRSRLAVLFQTVCPELVASQRPRQPPPDPPPRPTVVHGCWQLDSQEAIPLAEHQRATITTVRDPVGAAILASQAFAVTHGARGRRLNWRELQQVIRSAGTRWGTLPDAIQTDHEVNLAGAPTDPAPSRLTLWLIGLGVTHQFIRAGTPTDQAAVERTHRTLDGFVGLPDPHLTLDGLQQRLDAERNLHNQVFASRASDCAGRPPLTAHPELLQPRHPYCLAWERALFDEQQVYAYLARIPLQRRVSSSGQIRLYGRSYSVGRARRRQLVTVRCDPTIRMWRVCAADATPIAQFPILDLDAATLTGLADLPPAAICPIQLPLRLVA